VLHALDSQSRMTAYPDVWLSSSPSGSVAVEKSTPESSVDRIKSRNLGFEGVQLYRELFCCDCTACGEGREASEEQCGGVFGKFMIEGSAVRVVFSSPGFCRTSDVVDEQD
jgi:hypothetical protein